ncbi:MAG: cation:proton antiporter, partial [Bacteroidota bacterium]
MKGKWNWIFYTLMLLGFGAIIYQVMEKGRLLETPASSVTPVTPVAKTSSLQLFSESFSSNLGHPLPILLLQIMVIVIVVRIFGFLFNKIGQPVVIGEIVAGIVLGPSILGAFFPGVFNFIFPAASFINLQFLSQVGLMLFMFVIGMELDINLFRKQAQEAVIISHASIIIPYTLGMTLALYLFKQFAPPDIAFSSFALFMGIAMSITAFPVLARIIQERNLTRTKLGAMAITCAAA